MFGFSDLEDRLLGPDGARALAESLGSVRSIAEQVRSSMRGGLAVEDHANAERILAAANAAEYILLKQARVKGT